MDWDELDAKFGWTYTTGERVSAAIRELVRQLDDRYAPRMICGGCKMSHDIEAPCPVTGSCSKPEVFENNDTFDGAYHCPGPEPEVCECDHACHKDDKFYLVQGWRVCPLGCGLKLKGGGR